MAPAPPSITAAESRSTTTRRQVNQPRTGLGGGPAGNEQLTAATGIVLMNGLHCLDAFTALHILAHLPGLAAAWRPLDPDQSDLLSRSSGGAGRLIAISGAMVGGLVLAIVLIPEFSAWTAPGALHHHRG